MDCHVFGWNVTSWGKRMDGLLRVGVDGWMECHVLGYTDGWVVTCWGKLMDGLSRVGVNGWMDCHVLG